MPLHPLGRALLRAAAGITVGVLVDAARVRRRSLRPDPRRFPPIDDEAEIDEVVERLLARMSVDDKLEQLSGDTGLPRFVWQYALRQAVGRGAPHVYAGHDERLGIPPLCFADGPRGVAVGRGPTCFPVTIARGASWDRELERRIGEAMARELRAIGANYSAAVCVNVLRHPGWGRAQETYGEDPYHLGELGVVLTEGLQRHNVMACVKHLALNSIERSRFIVDVRVDDRTLHEVYLPAFRAVIQRGRAASVMSAYNKVRGEHCGHSHLLLTEILREQWGFEGFVSSDWVHGIRDGVAAIRAGMDVEMPARRCYGAALRRAIERGEVESAQVDRCVRRVLRTRLRFALAPDPEEYSRACVGSPAHVALAREAAEASAVLVRNDGTLPLPSSLRRLAVVGRLASMRVTGDRGSSVVHPRHVITPLQGLKAALRERGGTVLRPSDPGVDAAVAAARSAEAAVVVVGLSHRDEGELLVLDPEVTPARARRVPRFGGPGDRVDLGLRARDVALVRAVASAQPRTVVVVIGSAVAPWGWLEDPGAVLYVFYAGMEGGHALARLLLGEVSPSGKLPFAIPADPADLPPFDPYAEQVEYGPWHGYARLDHFERPALLPFGFGLSYTTFAYDHLRVTTPVVGPLQPLQVEVRVRNAGERPGAEVVQLYVGFPQAVIERPRKLLRGFEKVMLEPGQARRVRFEVPWEALAYWDQTERTWRVEAVTHEVHVGGSSEPDALLTGRFEARE
ncbi:beta-glucosidase [Paraliomyxa miuraensis]|uniref:beta-glucosidase n=1 Tax=Paraliomyxa miuraensis TaxID=376150 RepID=UPI002259485D|nr:glycoside hydrolase family 3 N-terminal domain-containing protein [Paraliomyxa miuraensis]MCX4244951.1 glycoside hydrolase family 3 C-terminal domain-containing protein [Paraliomyxa miuraensis]